MTWPPNNQPTGGKSDSTPMATDHPTEHNAIKATLDDIIAENAGALPLTGGTVTGDLQVKGSTQSWSFRTGNGNLAAPSYSFYNDPTTGLFRQAEGVLGVAGDLRAFGDLQVDGNTQSWSIKNGDGNLEAPSYSFYNDPTTGLFRQAEGVLGVAGDLRAFGDLQVDGVINGTLAFGIAEGIDTADVLDRAETATMPAVDDEGVTTTDADVESVTVNEVVTALLAKVKELSAEIEELRKA